MTPRATDIPTFAGLMQQVFAGDPAPYSPRASDVIISPYGKCGTTMLQQIFHQLRTGGDMDFDDISRVVPWIEADAALGLGLDDEQRANPRGFKSHLPRTALPDGARYLVSLRDPVDAFASLYRFMEGWFIEPGVIPMNDFLDFWFGQDAVPGYAAHLISWWEVRDRPEVLLLSYRGLVADKRAHIARIAAFADTAADDALLDTVEEMSSRAFMLEHKDRFDDAMLRHRTETVLGLPPGSDSAKVREGGDGNRHGEVPQAAIARIEAMWDEHIAPVTGHASFAELEADLG